MRKVLYIMGQLNDSDIEWMAEAGRQRMFRGGETLIEEGRDSPSLFIVLDGEVEVVVEGVGRVALLGSGEILGEMSFVDKAPPSATVLAPSSAKVLVLQKRQVEDRLARDQGFAARFYRALAIFLADRLRGTVQRRKSDAPLSSAIIEDDELDDSVLDNVSVAGLRFQQMLKTLAGVHGQP
jgi:CRP/FNR family cyclic AMP-dependent transcriptional regulator